jgi:hypothetical protein
MFKKNLYDIKPKTSEVAVSPADEVSRSVQTVGTVHPDKWIWKKKFRRLNESPAGQLAYYSLLYLSLFIQYTILKTLVL